MVLKYNSWLSFCTFTNGVQNLFRYNPLSAMENFNRQFQINKKEQEAVEWGWSKEGGDTMFNIANAYTRGSQFEGLSAESSYRLQKVGGNILEMVR